MKNNYYLAIVSNLKIGNEELDAAKITDILFEENIWLFDKETPNIDSLRKGDRLLIYGAVKGRNCVLGRLTIKTVPQEQRRPYVGLVNELSKNLSLISDITSKVKWEEPKPLGILAPDLKKYEKKKLASHGLSPDLKPLSQPLFERIVKAGEGPFSYDKTKKIPADTGANPEDEVKEKSVEKTLAALELAEWFERVFIHELPERQSELTDMMKKIKQISKLEEQLSTYRLTVQEHKQTVRKLKQENRQLKDEFDSLHLSFTQQKRQWEEQERLHERKIHQLVLERNKHLEEIKSLQLKTAKREKELKEATNIKQNLHEIASLLQAESVKRTQIS